jgi:hypothetical protein
MTAASMARFMPQMSWVWSRATVSKGQLDNTIVPPARCGAYPCSVSASHVQSRSRSRFAPRPAAARAWSPTVRPRAAAATLKASVMGVPSAIASSMARPIAGQRGRIGRPFHLVSRRSLSFGTTCRWPAPTAVPSAGWVTPRPAQPIHAAGEASVSCFASTLPMVGNVSSP